MVFCCFVANLLMLNIVSCPTALFNTTTQFQQILWFHQSGHDVLFYGFKFIHMIWTLIKLLYIFQAIPFNNRNMNTSIVRLLTKGAIPRPLYKSNMLFVGTCGTWVQRTLVRDVHRNLLITTNLTRFLFLPRTVKKSTREHQKNTKYSTVDHHRTGCWFFLNV